MGTLRSRKLLVGLVILLLLGAVIATYYFYSQYQKTQQLLNNPSQASEEEIHSLVKKLGQYIDLPQETPTLATVSDKEKLKDESFFAKAENGDKVLLYPNSRKAILYRPSTNKVIEISSVNLGSASQSSATSPTPSLTPTPTMDQPFKIALYNGTNTPGLARDLETKIKAKLTQAQTTSGDTLRKEQAKTIVVDVNGSKKDLADLVAKTAGGEVGSLPDGEVKPAVDIIVIIGTNYIK